MTPKKPKGFKLPKRTALLVFEGEYEGAEVRVRLTVPLGVFLDFGEVQTERPLEAYGMYMDAIVLGWNLEDDDGNPIPATREGMRQHVDQAFMLAMVRAWSKAAAEIPGPLASGSGNGGVADPSPQN